MPQSFTSNNELKAVVNDYFDVNLKDEVVNRYGPIGEWKFGPEVTDMSSLFFKNSNFNEDISDWDVSRVTNMRSMFEGAHSFNQDISRWNVGQVTDMEGMFQANPSSFNQDLSGWNVGQVTNMARMFRYAKLFNADLSSWDVSKVTNMFGMFDLATSFNADLSRWDVSKVTRMNWMFWRAESFNGDLSRWDVGQVTDMSRMFENAKSFNGDLSSWDVGLVTDMSFMFRYAKSFKGDLSSWDVSKVTSMGNMFEGALAFNQDISRWDVSGVTNMKEMFNNAKSFNADLSCWDVGKVTNMEGMFQSTDSFNQDISRWDVGKVTNMYKMFRLARKFNQDISSWDVRKVTTFNGMSRMFENADSFNQDISRWDVGQVTNMSYMFRSADSFNQDISRWDVSSVTKMREMFADAKSFNQDLSCWDVSSVNNINFGGKQGVSGVDKMFYGASSFDGDSIQSWPLTESKEVINKSNILGNTLNGNFGSNFDYYSWFINGSTYIGCIDDIEVKLNPGTNQIDVVWDDPKMITKPNSSLVFDLNFNGDTQTGLTFRAKRQKTLGEGRYTVKYRTINLTSGVENIKSFTILVKEDLTATSCFTGDAVVKTDQGLLPIKDITTNHTINHVPIKGVSKTIYSQNKVVSIKKAALGKNQPSQNTIVAPFHNFIINGKPTPAFSLVNEETISLVQYNNQPLFNIILDTLSTMDVNNLVAETLDPNTLVAKLFDGSMSEHQRAKVAKSLNAYHANLKAKPNKRLKDYRV